MNEVIVFKTKEDLALDEFENGKVHRAYIHLTDNSLGVPWKLPIIIVKGKNEGPTLGITAAVHGNELNGTSTIFKLINDVDPLELNGTLVMIPISNVPAFLMNQRVFSDNVDLNRIMPGSPTGASSKLYAHYFTSKIVSQFNYLLDLHTASPGRVNSLYIRADLEKEDTRTLAYLQNPQIIVQKYDEEGTLRGWANENGIAAITIEIGNPNTFQHSLVDETLDGIKNTLIHLKMLEGEVKDLIHNATICDHSYWIYSKKGGILDVFPKLADEIQVGQVIARVYNVFGEVKEEIKADKSGVVIGKSINPNCDAGTRILHLGVNQIEPMPENIPGHDDFLEK